MNNINRIIFVDSTINHQELYPYIDENDALLPAIKRGDLIQALRSHPHIKTAIIIDGVFEQQASITHKEILWAIAQGIEIIGIASIGALRAYELRDNGVVGYGKVYQSYLTGVLEGDDEVATSYFTSNISVDKTIAMVNIRHTLEKLNHYNEEIIVKIRSIHFKKRTWISLAAAIPDEMYRMLKAHYIDQKKEDVLYYFKRHRTHEKPLTPITRNDAIPFRGLSVKSNSYILKYLVSFLYAGSIDFIEKKLERMTLNSKQSFEQAFVETASDISIYLEFKHCHVPKIASILYELRAFNYSKTKLEKESAKIRREQKLYLSSALITYLESKQIPKNRLPAIVEGIIMLEDYFLNHSQLFNTL